MISTTFSPQRPSSGSNFLFSLKLRSELGDFCSHTLFQHSLMQHCPSSNSLVGSIRKRSSPTKRSNGILSTINPINSGCYTLTRHIGSQVIPAGICTVTGKSVAFVFERPRTPGTFCKTLQLTFHLGWRYRCPLKVSSCSRGIDKSFHGSRTILINLMHRNFDLSVCNRWKLATCSSYLGCCCGSTINGTRLFGFATASGIATFKDRRILLERVGRTSVAGRCRINAERLTDDCMSVLCGKVIPPLAPLTVSIMMCPWASPARARSAA